LDLTPRAWFRCFRTDPGPAGRSLSLATPAGSTLRDPRRTPCRPSGHHRQPSRRRFSRCVRTCRPEKTPMTDVRDTDPTVPEAEALEGEQPGEVAAADLPMVDQEADDEEDDGEPIVPNGRITLAELNEKTPADLVAFAEQLE